MAHSARFTAAPRYLYRGFKKASTRLFRCVTLDVEAVWSALEESL